mgnify:CR=1 FL=1
MKNKLTILLFSSLFLFSCKKEGVTTPAVKTTSIQVDKNNNTATANGEVTAEGASAVSKRGFVWSTVSNPTVSDASSSNQFGPGVFTQQISGLNLGTTYYVRAFATNSNGTTYGNQLDFKTLVAGKFTSISFDSLSFKSVKINVNIEDISIGMGLDKRIGSRFLRAGPAYGGSCFPKDTKAITATANKFKTNLTVIKSVIKSNENRSSLMLKKVFEILKNKIKNKNICFLGVTFKANTDDMRDSSSLTMIPALIKKGAKINYFDPTGEKLDFKKFNNVTFSNNIKDAIKKSDLIIIHTEWNDFKNIDFKKDVINKKFSIFDMRNIYSVNKMKDNKIKYFSIGN